MHNVLLIGAGFSRNWGGWLANEAFEYLLGCPQLTASDRALLWKHHDGDGFEGALGELQAGYSGGTRTFAEPLQRLQAAISGMFKAMNDAFKFMPGVPNTGPGRGIGPFLDRFDAIFSLNQDLLIEMQFFGEKSYRISGKWDEMDLPGVERIIAGDPGIKPEADGVWAPRADGKIEIKPRLQPLFKLHGSSSWRLGTSDLLVIGGDKTRAIVLFPILAEYFRIFQRTLLCADTRLMIIGYGFRDQHINSAIIAGVDRGLQFFVIDPLGASVAKALNTTRSRGAIAVPTELERLFERGLIGASRRPLLDIFGRDTVEWHKIQRFFAG